jgi:hypothetical protein
MNAVKSIHNMKDALKGLGIEETTLTKEERFLLDQNGYLLLNQIMDSKWLEELSDGFEKSMQKEGFLEGRIIEQSSLTMGDLIKQQFSKEQESHGASGNHRVDNLVNKGSVYDGVYTHPKVLAAVHHILGDQFKLSAMSAAETLEGEGSESLHISEAVKCIWLLDGLSGSTRSIRIHPGSQLQQEPPSDRSANEVLLHAAAGSVLVLHPRVWHGGIINRGVRNHRVIDCEFIKRGRKPKVNQMEFIRRTTYSRITEAAKYILNVSK